MPRGRPRSGRRVLGPYPDAERGGFAVVAIEPRPAGRAQRRVVRFATRDEADAAADYLRRSNPDEQQHTIASLIDAWELERRARGYVLRACASQASKVRQLLAELIDRPIGSLTAAQIAQAVRRRQTTCATATVASELRTTKTFARWCVIEHGRGRPQLLVDLERVRVQGPRGAGKLQLTRDEAERFTRAGLAEASEGSIAAVALLLLGVRAGELLTRDVRDVDEGGAVLWIQRGKTGRRRIGVAQVLRPHLWARAEGRAGDAALWPSHDPDVRCRSLTWLQRAVARLCERSGVTVVCPHGLRGTHVTLALAAGQSSEAVASAVGHSPEVARRHYADPGAVDQGARDRVLRAITGGRR